MASRIYTTHTEEPQAQQSAHCHSKENRLADNMDCFYSCLLCQPGISDLGTGVSPNSLLFQSSNAYLPKCMSDKWKTFALFPLLAGTLVSAGLSFGNLTLTGITDGALQKVVLKEEQIYCPSKPATSALDKTCVQTAPKLPAS